MRKQNAYFTVEAALILPLVMSAVLMEIFLLMFQYDRCVLEQDVNRMTICAAAVAGDTTEELEQKIRSRMRTVSMEKYLAWNMEKFQLEMVRGKVEVSGGGSFELPLPEWNLFTGESAWSAEVKRKAIKVSPTDFIRLYRKVKGE